MKSGLGKKPWETTLAEGGGKAHIARKNINIASSVLCIQVPCVPAATIEPSSEKGLLGTELVIIKPTSWNFLLPSLPTHPDFVLHLKTIWGCLSAARGLASYFLTSSEPGICYCLAGSESSCLRQKIWKSQTGWGWLSVTGKSICLWLQPLPSPLGSSCSLQIMVKPSYFFDPCNTYPSPLGFQFYLQKKGRRLRFLFAFPDWPGFCSIYLDIISEPSCVLANLGKANRLLFEHQAQESRHRLWW